MLVIIVLLIFTYKWHVHRQDKFENTNEVVMPSFEEGQTMQSPKEKGQTFICKTMHREHCP